MSAYTNDRKWSDIFIPSMKQIIGPLLLVTSSFAKDTKEASDLVVLQMQTKDIACRIRRPGYFHKYGYEFTVRYERSSGTTTEFEKLSNGYADWMFYGHANDNQGNIRFWWLLDLDVWRNTCKNDGLHQLKQKRKFGITPNVDNTTSFAWFDIRAFPSEFVVASGSAIKL